MGSCRTLPLWQGLDKVISEYLDSVTLADLMQQAGVGNDYVI
jgi:DNA-binding IscR family transcriptional regulator